MPTIVGILTFINMINTIPDRLKAINFFWRYLSFYEQLKSCEHEKSYITVGPDLQLEDVILE